MTSLQKRVLAAVIVTTEAGRWHRATGNGERVTLASLYYRGLAVRRAWRGREGERDAAHEYRASEQVMNAWRCARSDALAAEPTAAKRSP